MAVDNFEYLNDEEDVCPLCVEEMDISDKRFKPCPCGYQICQFCYNNIRQNPELNGRCPACRRKYDDESVQYVELTPDEIKSEKAKQVRKDKERKQREKERKEQENASRKHLAGMRVIQKNLVYVVGLNPPIPPEELHSSLRSDRYFGQYGKILKVVVNKRNQNANLVGNSGYGIYVTFLRKEDADRCIRSIDGSLMDGKTIRAAYGTTKYCSSYLRGSPCPNPNCMFLHEPGEEADSYTRQDMSTHQGNELSRRHHEGGIIRYGIVNKNEQGVAQAAPVIQSTSSHIETTLSHVSDHSDDESKPGLPATVAWVKSVGGTSQTGSPGPKAATLANASAFPTLAETALQRNASGSNLNHLVHKEKRKEKHKDLSTRLKDAGDELAVNENSTNDFIGETLSLLTTARHVDYQFKVGKFRETFNEDLGSFPPMFSFDPNTTVDLDPEADYLLSGADIVHSIITNNKANNFLYQVRLGRQTDQPQEPLRQPQQEYSEPPVQLSQASQESLQSGLQATSSTPPGLLAGQEPAHNNHSSEILNHLFNGKKIAA